MGIDHSKLQKTFKSSGGAGWKPREGQNRIRILPPSTLYFSDASSLSDYAVRYRLHFLRPPGGGKSEAFRCLEDVGQKCPACAAWRRIKGSEDVGLKEIAKNIRPSEQFAFNILDLENPQAGIQVYQANWTCYSGIMEIGANPAWGDIISPVEGINFALEKVPAQRSKTGYNAYTVMPEPQRTSVVEILSGIPNWKAALDELDSTPNEPQEAAGMVTMLLDLGLAVPGWEGQVQAPPAMAPTPAPPVASPAPPAPPVAPPAVAPAPPVQPAPGPPAASQDSGSGPHYDPGPGYTPKMSDEARPSGAPRCFSDYSPKLHACETCPVQTDCQMAYLGVPT